MKVQDVVDFYKRLDTGEKVQLAVTVLSVPIAFWKMHNEVKHRPVPGRPVGFRVNR